MPTCPLDRTCSWVIRGPHHDWWTTTAGALVLAFGLALLTGLLAWAILQRQRTERHRVTTDSYERGRDADRARDDAKVRARVMRDEEPRAVLQDTEEMAGPLYPTRGSD
jgi:formylmethanofuran dehydrogenase subunit E